MSRSDYGAAAPGDQDKKPELTAEERLRLEFRFKLGAVYAKDLEWVYGISHNTVGEWEDTGLHPFRPSTDGTLYLTSEVQSYFEKKLTFTRRGRLQEKKANAKQRKTEERMG